MKVRTEEEAHIAQPCKTDPLTLFAARGTAAPRRGTHEHEHALRLGLTRADVGWMVALVAGGGQARTALSLDIRHFLREW